MKNMVGCCALVGALVLITACAGGETVSTGSSAASDPTSSSITSSSTTSSSTSATATTQPSTTTTAGAIEGGGSDECIIGTWEVDAEAFLDQVFSDAGAELPTALEAVVAEGNYTLEFAPDGTYRSVRDQFTIEASGFGSGTLVFVVDADLTGDWSTAGDQLTLEPATGDVNVSARMEVSGEVLEVPFDAEQMLGDQAMAGTSTFTCAGEEMTVTFQGYTQTLHRLG